MRRLAEGAQKSAAHAFAVGKARLCRDHVDRMPALLHHQPRGFDPQMSRPPWPAIARSRRGMRG